MMGAPTAPAVYLAKAKVQFETYKSIYGSKALHRLVLSHIYLAPSLNSMGKKKKHISSCAASPHSIIRFSACTWHHSHSADTSF